MLGQTLEGAKFLLRVPAMGLRDFRHNVHSLRVATISLGPTQAIGNAAKDIANLRA